MPLEAVASFWMRRSSCICLIALLSPDQPVKFQTSKFRGPLNAQQNGSSSPLVTHWWRPGSPCPIAGRRLQLRPAETGGDINEVSRRLRACRLHTTSLEAISKNPRKWKAAGAVGSVIRHPMTDSTVPLRLARICLLPGCQCCPGLPWLVEEDAFPGLATRQSHLASRNQIDLHNANQVATGEAVSV